jgi:hypothetical protein
MLLPCNLYFTFIFKQKIIVFIVSFDTFQIYSGSKISL